MKICTFVVGPLSTNCYLVTDEENRVAFIVDPGDCARKLLSEVNARGATLTHIILTHGHFDHVLAVQELAESTGAKIVIHKEEEPLLQDPGMGGYRSFGISDFAPIVPDVLVEDRSELEIGGMQLTFYHTPGHTPGSMCIAVDDVLFAGDTLFAGSCGRCDLPGGNFKKMYASLKRLGELPGNFRVYPGHAQNTNLDSERMYNPYLREAMAR